MEEAWELAVVSSSREQVLSELASLHKELDRAPSMREFARRTNIRETEWLGKYWAKWSDLLSELDLNIQKPFGTYKYTNNELLEPLLQLALRKGKLPTRSEVRMASLNGEMPSYNTYKRNFGLQADLARALLEFSPDRLSDTLKDDLENRISKNRSERRIEAQKSDGFVYLMKSGKYFKIGRTNNLDRRQYEIGIQLPQAIEPIHSIQTDDPSGIEAYWHNRFTRRRLNGEWFNLNADDIRAFKRRKFM